MEELQFVKAFLAALDQRPSKLSADHAYDAHDFPIRFPFTLPRLSPAHPVMPKKRKYIIPPGSSKSVSVLLKSMRSPSVDIRMENVSLGTLSVQDLKNEVHARVESVDSSGNHSPVALPKIKILYKRKPAHGTLVIDALGDEAASLSEGGTVEFGYMVLGSGVLTIRTPREKEPRETNESVPEGKEAPDQRKSPDSVFWDDLGQYLVVKIGDPTEASEMLHVFRSSWESR